MIRCTIMTGWDDTPKEIQPGVFEPNNTPKVFVDHKMTAHCKWTDITNQPVENLAPDPNLYSIQAEITQELHDAIDADNNYFITSSELI